MTLIFDSKKVKEKVECHNEREGQGGDGDIFAPGVVGEDFFKEVTRELTLSFSDW